MNTTKEKIWSHKNPALLNTPSICWSCIPTAETCLGLLGKQIDGYVRSKVYIFFPWWKGSLQGWFRHKLQEMRNVLANAQGSVHVHCMFLSTSAYSISYFTIGSSICTNRTQPSFAEDKQNLMEPPSVPNKLQHSSSFLLLYKRLKVTSSHELSGKTVICSGMQCRLQLLEGPFLLEISQCSTGRGLIARGWVPAAGFCSSSEPSPPTVALLCIEDYWLS